jgi:diadenosine tetraphosphate (Ap4A) HIT family hydrolase|tara:strand:- start:32 stop:433 length:402 start_codon:yes stop_codon:yes gene_type:complete
MFKLDNRIEQDSFLVKEFNDFQIRIMDVREVFWVILIPTKINLIELSDLDIEKRNILINFAVELGDFLKSNEEYDKVNIAMLGNVVSQLHLHLVMRNKHDPAWPGPVWGFNFKNKLDEKSKSNRSKLILQFSK